MSVRVLVAGVPRSGTTWVGRVLGLAASTRYVHEPDNHLVRPEAWWAKRRLGPFPAIAPGQSAPEYERLWERAFGETPRPSLRYAGARLVHHCVPAPWRGALRSDVNNAATATLRVAGAVAVRRPVGTPASNLVVKSVFCARSLEWLDERFAPAVVVVQRNPLAVVASWAELGWSDFLDGDPIFAQSSVDIFGVPPPGRGAPWIDRAAWQCGFLSSLLERAAARHDSWQVVRHESLCGAPSAAFRTLSRRIGLGWTREAEQFLASSNRPGRGYSTNRLRAGLIDRWRTQLSPSDQERALDVLSAFPPPSVDVTDGAIAVSGEVPPPVSPGWTDTAARSSTGFVPRRTG